MDSPKNTIRVFISSTSKDLQDYRKATKEFLKDLKEQGLQIEVIDMADFAATEQNSMQLCYQKVQKSTVLIGIYAYRYGFVPPDNNSKYKKIDGSEDTNSVDVNGEKKYVSITEMEYRWAKEKGIPTLLFVINDSEPGYKKEDWQNNDEKKEFVDSGETKADESDLQTFKSSIKAVYRKFTTPESLVEGLRISFEYAFEQGNIPNIRNIPKTQDSTYIKTQDFKKLKKLLLNETISKIAVSGIAGIGKTRLVYEVLQDSEIRFSNILWANLGQIPPQKDENISKKVLGDLEIIIKDWFKSVEPNNQPNFNIIKASIKNFNQSSDESLNSFIQNKIANQKTLIVLDDVRDARLVSKATSPFILQESSLITYLIITQDKSIASSFATKNHVEMQPLSPNHAYKLFKENLQKDTKKPILTLDETVTRNVLKALDNLPYMVLLVSCYVKSFIYEKDAKIQLNELITDSTKLVEFMEDPNTNADPAQIMKARLNLSFSDLIGDKTYKPILASLGLFPSLTPSFSKESFTSINQAENIVTNLVDRNLFNEISDSRLQQYRMIHDYALNIFEKTLKLKERIKKISQLIAYFDKVSKIQEEDLPVISAVLDIAFKHKPKSNALKTLIEGLPKFVLKMVPVWAKHGLQYTPYHHLLDALKQAKKQNDQIKLLAEISWIEIQVGNTEEALEHLDAGWQLVLKHQTNERDYLYEAHYCTSYAEHYHRQDNNEEWKKWIDEAQKIKEEADQKGQLDPLTPEWAERSVAIDNHRASYISEYEWKEDPQQDPLPILAEAIKKANKAATKAGLTAQEISLRLNVAHHYVRRFEKSMGFYKLSIDALEKRIQDELAEVDNLLNEGHHSNIFDDTITKEYIYVKMLKEIYLGKLQPEIIEKLQEIEKKIEAEPQYQNMDNTLYIWRDMGELYAKNGEIDKAIVYFMKSAEVAKNRQNVLDLAINYNMLGEALKPEEALALYAHALLLAPSWFGEIEAKFSWEGIQRVSQTDAKEVKDLFYATQLAALHRYLSSYDGLETRLMTRMIALLGIGDNSHILVCSGGDVRLPNALRNTGKLSGQTVTHFDPNSEYPWFIAPQSKYITMETKRPIGRQGELPKSQTIMIVSGNILIEGEKPATTIETVIQIAQEHLAEDGKLLLELDAPIPAFSDRLQSIWWWKYQASNDRSYTWTFTPQEEQEEQQTYPFTITPINFEEVVKTLQEAGFSVQNSRDDVAVFKAFTDALLEFKHHPNRVYVLATKKIE
jgi:hypothetical protein